jgi:hypothetical protein
MRRFDIGPLIVALGALVLLVSLFLDWYAGESAWGAFEVADVLIAALALGALAVAAGLVADGALPALDRRWMPALVLAAAVLVIAEILSPPPVVGDADPQEGAWIAFASVLVMLAGAVLSLGRVSFSFAIEGREPRHRVAAVDHRPPTTEAGAPVPRSGEETGATEALPETGTRRGGKAR